MNTSQSTDEVVNSKWHWEATTQLRNVVRPDGTAFIQQLFKGYESRSSSLRGKELIYTGKFEWRALPVVRIED